jgi:hypothetical protein
VHDGDVWRQVGTHLTCFRTIEEDLGCIWERVGQIGSMPREWTCLPLETWVCQRGWKTPSTHLQGFTMIGMKIAQGKGVHSNLRNKRLMDAWDLDGCIGSTNGRNESIEFGLVKGNDPPKRHEISHK